MKNKRKKEIPAASTTDMDAVGEGGGGGGRGGRGGGGEGGGGGEKAKKTTKKITQPIPTSTLPSTRLTSSSFVSTLSRPPSPPPPLPTPSYNSTNKNKKKEMKEGKEKKGFGVGELDELYSSDEAIKLAPLPSPPPPLRVSSPKRRVAKISDVILIN